jgi:hypothetical protein
MKRPTIEERTVTYEGKVYTPLCGCVKFSPNEGGPGLHGFVTDRSRPPCVVCAAAVRNMA